MHRYQAVRCVYLQKLTKNQFDKAVEFIELAGRPLERALYKYHFEPSSRDQVLAELAKFQNADGGFGNALEPDLRVPDSSAIATSVAFQVLREVSAPSGSEIVQSGLRYLADTFNEDIGGWEPIPWASEQYPRASWWSYQEIAEGDRMPTLAIANPGSELIGYFFLFDYDSPLIAQAYELVLDAFRGQPDEMEMHALMCFIRLAEMASSGITGELLPKLRRSAELVSGRTAVDWEGYGGRPLWFAGTPTSLLADDLSEPIQNELDYLIATQSESGSWQPPWSWGQYEDEWLVAKNEWAGWLTLRNLVSLKHWNRIEHL